MLVFKIFLLLLLLALPLSAQSRAPTTVILVRHAEKAATPTDDPPLTEEGRERAQVLMDIARQAGVTAIITTQFARTRETARPAAESLKITPEVIRAAAGPQHAQDVARAALAHQGGVVLVVGHSNTIPAIIEALGAPKPPMICDPQYDNLYVVTVPPSGAAHLIHARYGAPPAVAVGCASMR